MAAVSSANACSICKSINHESKKCTTGCKSCRRPEHTENFLCSKCGIPTHQVIWCSICDERGHKDEECKIMIWKKEQDEYSSCDGYSSDS
jgi:hypothetical protein